MDNWIGMKLPKKINADFYQNINSFAWRINEILDYLEAKENFHSETPILSRDEECKQILNQKWETDSETKEPMFKAEELEDDQIYESEDGKWILQAVYYKEFETEEAAREALLKLTN